MEQRYSGVTTMPILRILCFALVGIGALGAGVAMLSREDASSFDAPVRAAVDCEPAPPETCNDLDACIARLRAIARTRNGGGMCAQEDQLASRLQAMPGVADAMMPLLADANIEVAKLAAYVLRDVDAIDPRHLPAIRAGLDRDLGWLAPALARIGTDEAAEEAVKRLLAEDDTGNQEGYAVKLFGKRAIPAMITAARCDRGCTNPDAHRLLGAVLSEMNAAGVAAVPGLLAICEDPATPDKVALGALGMIGNLGLHAQPWQDNVEALAKTQPALTQAVEEVIVNIHGDHAVALLSARLQRVPDIGVLFDLAELRQKGRAAVPQVTPLLTHADPELRENAARTLGYIGDTQAVPALIRALEDPADVRLNLAAATALGRLRDAAASTSLQRTAKGHWHPWVRAASAKALTLLDTPRDAENPRRLDFYRESETTDLGCEHPALGVTSGPSLWDRIRIARLRYTATVVGYGPPKGAKPNADEVTTMTPETMIRQEDAFAETPHTALRLDQGWLAGADRGEWGGELMWLGDDGDRQKVVEGNIESIYRLGARAIAVSGLAHLSRNSGVLLEVSRDASGSWRATPWRILPGAPRSSGMTAGGDLLVNTYAGGPVLIDARGGMRMAGCRDGL